MKARVLMIGCGWRSQFYLRAMKELSQDLELSAVVMHSKERAEEVQKELGVFATDNLEEALKVQPDFALICVPKPKMSDWIKLLMEKHIPVLSETPPGYTVEELNTLWEEKVRLNGKVQVSEQYFFQPYYHAVQNIIDEGTLGEISSVNMSAIHGYHAISIFRKFMGIGFENCEINGKTFHMPVMKTRDRSGWIQTGEIIDGNRFRVDFLFENEKYAFLDFDNEQYFSPIRGRYWNVQGVKGEIWNTRVCYMDEENSPIIEEMHREDDGIYNIDGWSHLHISFGGKRLYENPFPGVRLNDDELAVADVLMHMKKYVETGEEFYPLRQGLQDAYLNICMEEALKSGKIIKTETQNWV